jgi:hypothetical protein
MSVKLRSKHIANKMMMNISKPKNSLPSEALPGSRLDQKIKSGYRLSPVWHCLFVILVTLLPSPAFAVACYSDREAEAEQAIRIHSELMVIGLNCQHRTPPNEKNYYLQYKEFTASHGPLFASYETRLIDYFKRAGYKNAEGELNQLRTQFANKISGDAAKMRPDLFCNYYAPRIPKVRTMTNAQIQKWASTFYRAHPLSQPICANAKVEMR